MAKNFPTVDAVLKPNSLFQMTIRDRHSVNMTGLGTVITGLLNPELDSKRLKGQRSCTDVGSSRRAGKTRQSFNFYFVVPSAPVTLFTSYKLPTISDESAIQGNVQYFALKLPLEASEGRVPKGDLL